MSPAFPRVVTAGERQPSAGDIVRVMRAHIGQVLGIAVCIAALAVAYAFLATPIYSSDVLVRVDPPEPNAFGVAPQGQILTQAVQPPTQAEIAIMQSRSVIEPVIQQYKFGVLAMPHAVPVLGALTKLFAKPGVPIWPSLRLDPGLGIDLDSYAWGGEQIDVASLTVPPQLEDKKLDLKAQDDGHYQLFDTAGRLLLSGAVGQPAQGNGVSMLVQRLVARSGTRFDVSGSNEVNTIHRFQSGLTVSDDGKDTGVVRITFSNRDPVVATGVANAVAQSYIAASIESHQGTDGKTLAFIQQELPRLRSDLQQAETDLTQFRTSSGSMEPVAEAQSYLQGGIDFQRQIALLQIQRTQLLQNFTPDSIQVHNVDEQLGQLNAYKQKFDARFSSMPASERENADLTRRAKVAEAIYTSMVNKAEELSVRRAGTTGNAHIVDQAVRPSLPIKPNRILVIAGGIGLGLIVAIGYVFVRYQVFGRVTDPMYIEQYLSVPLFGSLAFSRAQASLETSAEPLRSPRSENHAEWSQSGSLSGNQGGNDDVSDEVPMRPGWGARVGVARTTNLTASLPPSAHRLLARSFPHDAAMEALRRVRTALRFEMIHAPNKIVAFTGPTAATGKSFVAANLAVLQAQTGSRVLLIDADMRCGRLASFFRQFNAGGLADVLRGSLPVRSAIRSVGIPNLSFMACGAYPANPSELLMTRTFSQLLGELGAQFDMVIVDTPPFLPVTDAAIVTPQAGATLLVLGSDMQSKKQVEDTVKGLDRTGAHLVGAVFNAMPTRQTSDPYGHDLNTRYVYEPRVDTASAA
jgi:tyrosine-protein kinase Etk/Wzc